MSSNQQQVSKFQIINLSRILLEILVLVSKNITIPENTIGINPNSSRENVYLSEILSNKDFLRKDIKLPIALENISGTPIIGDLASMPHLLIAGTTGSGKSVCITILLSLYSHTPENCIYFN